MHKIDTTTPPGGIRGTEFQVIDIWSHFSVETMKSRIDIKEHKHLQQKEKGA